MDPTRLRYLREKHKMKLEEVADRLGVARTTYVNYESGFRLPDLNTLKKITQIFDTTADFLLGLSDIESNREIQENQRYEIDKSTMRVTEQFPEKIVRIEEGGHMALDTQSIRERLNKATTHRGKWIVRNDGVTVGVEGLGDICEVKVARFELSTFRNAEFIANAPTDIEALLKEIERLRNE